MTLKVGSEVDAWCTKCRMDLSHLIVALLAGQPKRVECQTCHTQHNYRAPKGATEPLPKEAAPATAAKKVKTPRVTKAQAEYNGEWDARCAGRSGEDFNPYSIKQVFEAEDLVKHKKFGQGFVFEVLDDNKITVFFKEGPRTLIHGRE